jgi:hypothetical protein
VQQSEKIRENVKKFCNSIYTALLIAWLLLCPGFVVSGGFFCPGFVCPGFVCLGFVRVPVVRFCVLRFDLKRDPYLVLNSSPIFECNNMTISRNMKVNFVAKPYPHLRTPRLRVTKFKPIRFQRKSFFLLSTKSKFQRNFILISSKFRCLDFPVFRFRCRNRNCNFGFDFDWLLSTKSKFRRSFILFSSKFRCRRNRNFNFSFDFDIGIPTVEIEIEIPITFSNFDQKFRKSRNLFRWKP